jgi:hypothetical protein
MQVDLHIGQNCSYWLVQALSCPRRAGQIPHLHSLYRDHRVVFADGGRDSMR